MNLLLLTAEDLLPDGTALLSGRRRQHLREVLHAREGDAVRVGLLGGKVGLAQVLRDDAAGLLLQLTLDTPPPPRAGVDLLLAVPRPKALKKVLPAIASLGVDRVLLLNAARVEKSYFDAHVLEPAALATLLQAGLEQGRDTVLPLVEVRARFRPFVEDELDGWCGPKALRLLPHPAAANAVPRRSPGQRVVLAIGPEGGWVPFEVELLRARGFEPVSLGARPLRVEVAVPALLGAVGL